LEENAMLDEERRRLLERLEAVHPALRAVAELLLDGYTNEEISKNVGCSVATVGRRRKTIRELWERELPP
jgi:DNA-directed RNA polymerase specialized sigma24 family protein